MFLPLLNFLQVRSKDSTSSILLLRFCYKAFFNLWCLCLLSLEYALPVPPAGGYFHWYLFGPPPQFYICMLLVISGYLSRKSFSDSCLQIPGCLIYFHYSNTCIQNYLLHSCLIYLSLVFVLNILLLHTSQLNESSFSLPWCLHFWCTDKYFLKR